VDVTDDARLLRSSPWWKRQVTPLVAPLVGPARRRAFSFAHCRVPKVARKFVSKARGWRQDLARAAGYEFAAATSLARRSQMAIETFDVNAIPKTVRVPDQYRKRKKLFSTEKPYLMLLCARHFCIE